MAAARRAFSECVGTRGGVPLISEGALTVLRGFLFANLPVPRDGTRYRSSRASAARAAWWPHMPWTPPPGGVEEEQR